MPNYKKDAEPTKSLAAEFEKAVELGVTDGTYPQRPATLGGSSGDDCTCARA